MSFDMETKERVAQIRKSTGLNRTDFCEYYGIPYKTVTDWEHGVRHAPEYVVRFLAYYVKMHKPRKKK